MMISRYLARRKMRWAVRYLAAMDAADRQVFKMSRRFDNYINGPLRITVTARSPSPEEREKVEKIENFYYFMLDNLEKINRDSWMRRIMEKPLPTQEP